MDRHYLAGEAKEKAELGYGAWFGKLTRCTHRKIFGKTIGLGVIFLKCEGFVSYPLYFLFLYFPAISTIFSMPLLPK
jgi:hypothetical protein